MSDQFRVGDLVRCVRPNNNDFGIVVGFDTSQPYRGSILGEVVIYLPQYNRKVRRFAKDLRFVYRKKVIK